MEILKGTRAYLAGPVEFSEDSESWRNIVAERLNDMGVESFDPLKKPEWFPNITGEDQRNFRKRLIDGSKRDLKLYEDDRNNRYIRKICLRLVAASDIVICYLPRQFTSGTFEELALANQQGKPILFVCPDKIPSAWLHAQFTQEDNWSSVFFSDWDELFQYLSMINNEKMTLDAYKWAYLTWNNKHGENDVQYQQQI